MDLEPTNHWRSPRIELFVLRPALVTQDYVDWLNDPLVNRFLESRFRRHDLDGTREFVAQALADPAVLFTGIRTRADGRHVGNIKLGPIDRQHRLGEVGILIGRVAWGQGIASEAIGLLARIAAAELGVRKLSAGCYAANTGSERAFVRAGFAVEGRRPAHVLLDGRPEDTILLGRLLQPN